MSRIRQRSKMRTTSRRPAARASFNVYTIPEEIDALAAGLREVVRIFER